MYELTTKFINQSLVDFVSDETFENVLATGDTKALETILSKIICEPYTWGKYIYEYLYEKYFSNQAAHYQDIPNSTYHELIGKLFAENGLENRGSLSSSTRLNQLIPMYEKPSTEIKRETVFLFAYGLGMNMKDLSILMRKALLQPVVNLRDPKEVIYFWCFNHDCGISKPKKIHELLNFYETLPLQKGLASNDLKTQNTQTLLEGFNQHIQNESQLKVYLQTLKNSDLKKNPLALRKQFHQNLQDMPRIDEEKLQLSCADIIKQLDDQRNNYYEEYKKSSSPLQNPDITKTLFKDINWTAKSLQKRFDGTQVISRNEFLLSIFFIYCAPLSEPEFRVSDPEKLKRGRYQYYRQMMDQALISCCMSPTYERNPFELFLFICMFHDKPYEYLMANWQQAILTSNES